MRIVLQVQSRRSPLDAAQQQVLDRVETDRTQSQGIEDGPLDLLDRERFQQTQYLHVLPLAALAQSRFQQPPQAGEALRQLPAHQRRSLIQCPCLLFQQGQIVQRIEDHVFTLIASAM